VRGPDTTLLRVEAELNFEFFELVLPL